VAVVVGRGDGAKEPRANERGRTDWTDWTVRVRFKECVYHNAVGVSNITSQ
jgi:hypothetical protein